LYVFGSKGKRVYNQTRAIKHGPYVDSLQTLLRLEMPKNAPTTYTIAVSEQYLPSRNHFFSLIAYSVNPAELSHVEERYNFSTSIDSAWTQWNAGGSTNSSSFSINPQFGLDVKVATPIAVLLECCVPDCSVNVKLCYGGGKRLFALKRQDTALDSYEYRKGSDFINSKEDNIEPGNYTIIASTFEAGQIGKFSLRVDSNAPVTVTELPSEYAGKIINQLQKAILHGQARKIAIRLTPLRIAKVSIVVKFASSFSPPAGNPPSSQNTLSLLDSASSDSSIVHLRSPLRTSLQFGRGPDAREIAASYNGEFSDGTVVGLRIFNINMYPDMVRHQDLYLVIERLGPGVAGSEERYSVELLIDGVEGPAVRAETWKEWDDY
jgi:calpain-7